MTSLVRNRSRPYYIGAVTFIRHKGMAYAMTDNKTMAAEFSEAQAALVVSLDTTFDLEMEEVKQGRRFRGDAVLRAPKVPRRR